MAMTPQQFGLLVGDQMGKDAGAVAPKSLPVEALKLMGKAVYHTPRSLKALAAGGAGGYALGHNAGEASGMEQGQAAAAKNLAERLLGQPAAGMKQAFLGAAGRAIGGAVSNAVSGAINAAKPMVNNAINAVGNAAMKNPTAATAAAAGGITAAAIPAVQHLENQRIDAQVDRQRARTMAQQPKPQMATGMPQAPAPQPAMSMVGKQADITAANNINPALAQQMAAAQPGVPSGPGGGLHMGAPSAPADTRRLGPGGAIRQQQVNAQQGQGLNPAQRQTMRTVTGVGQPMPKMPSNGVMPAGTGQGGIMGGGGPLSMSLAGKQAGAINELLSEFGGRAAQGLKTHARPMLDKAVSGVQTYGKRMMGDSTLKPLYARADLMHDMGKDLLPYAAGPASQAKSLAQDAYHNLLSGRTNAYKAINKERGAIDLTRNLTTGGAAAGTIGAIGLAARNNNKQASLTEGVVAGVPMGLAGAGAGLGAGGLYGLLSGAYEAKKGKKLKGALGGLLRGAGGGALVGGGIGAGAGLGGGFMMPNVLSSNPFMQAVHSANLALNPATHLAKMTAGGIAGGVVGGSLANSQRKKMQASKPTDNKKDDADEGEENTNDGEQLKSKAAAVKAALVEGAVIGGGLGAASAPKGHVAESVGRGMVRGVGTELGATIGAGAGGLAGGFGGGVAGGAGGLATGALLSALTRRPISAGAIKGMGYGGTAGVFGGAGAGGAAGLYHGGRAGYDAAGKIMGPATYKDAAFMGKSVQGARGLIGKGVLGLTGLAGIGAGKPLVSLQSGLNATGKAIGEAAAEGAHRIDNFRQNNASPLDVIGSFVPGAQRLDDVGLQLNTALPYPAGHFMSKHRAPAKNVAERLLRMFETPGTREFGK